MFAFLNLHTVVAVRVSRPCRTTCRSQDKERSLRSEAHSAGVPSLQAQQLTSVQQANALISFFCFTCGTLPKWNQLLCFTCGTLPTWWHFVFVRASCEILHVGSPGVAGCCRPPPLKLRSTSWNQCMLGAALDVLTQVQHNIPGVVCLAARCSKHHKHILAPVLKTLVRRLALRRAWAEC